MSKKPNRNDPCPCGSGKKYKQCCLKKETTKTYTPAGKRKFKAKVLGAGDVAGSVLGRMNAPKPDSGDLERLKVKMTNSNFEKKAEAQEEKSEELKTPKFKKIPTKRPGDDFKSPDHDFEVDKK